MKSITSLLKHFRDYFIQKSPLKFRTEINYEVLLHNRCDFELYQQIFVKNVFNLSSIQKLLKKMPLWSLILVQIVVSSHYEL
jgi:hypothetical protein